MTLFIVLVVVVVVAAVAAALVIRSRNRQANISRAEELRATAAGTAQATIAPAQQRAAVAEERAEEAREVAEKAEAEAEQARLEASRVEAEHEAQVRAADRLDPRVDHRADDYQPQVAGTVDQSPTPPSEANPAPAAEPTASGPATATEPVAEPTAEPTPEPAPEPTATAEPEAPVQQPDPAQPDPAQPAEGSQPPLLPRRTPGANDMPGKPIESTDGGGGWFTRKEPPADRS